MDVSRQIKVDSLKLLPEQCVQTGSRESSQLCTATGSRNLFSELERLRHTTISKDKVDVCYLPQPGAVSRTITHDSSTYMDAAIQPSPKDSGVDISSPERKIDDLGDLSSRESSPRFTDPTLQRDTGQSQPKYANIVNIQSSSAKLRYSDEVQKEFHACAPAVSNMNSSVIDMDQNDNIQPVPIHSRADHTGHDSGNESGQDMVYVRMHDDDEGGLLDPGDIIVDPMSKTGFSVVHHSTSSDLEMTSPNLYQSQISNQSVISADIPISDDGLLGGNGCTLTELNMSQKSTEVDLQGLVHTRSSTMMDLSSDDSDDHYNYCDDEDSMDTDLFGSLAESTPSFSLNGTPSNKMYITPQSTPCGSSAQTPSSSRVSAPVRSKSNPSMHTGFMSEFEKFLQQSSKSKKSVDDGVKCNSDKSHDTINNLSKPVNRQLLPPVVGASNMRATSRNSQSRAFHLPDSIEAAGKAVSAGKKHSPLRNMSKRRVPRRSWHEKSQAQTSEVKIFQTCAGRVSVKSSTDQFEFSDEPSVSSAIQTTVQESESRHLCHCTKSSSKFNVKRFIKADKRIMQLRRETLKFLKTVFPDMDFPSSKRALVTVDVLLSQVLDCVTDRQYSGKRLQVIPTEHHTLDVRILACKSPQACLRHLRRRICRVLEAVLPDLNLRWPFNQGSDSVDALLKEIVLCNKMTS